MILLDSNIVIYLRAPKIGKKILEQLGSRRLHTCNIVIAEVLGYKGVSEKDSQYFNETLSAMANHLFDSEITKKTIEIRKSNNIELPDAIIASTALVNNLELWTHNVKDFRKVQGLKVYDPIAS